MGKGATSRGAEKASSVSAGTNSKSEVFSYTLAVDPGLFGKLRIRCWAEGEVRPSKYSEEVVIHRWNGKIETFKSPQEVQVDKEIAAYYTRLGPQHITDGGCPVRHRIGNTPSCNVWGGDAMLAPPSCKQRPGGAVPVPIPYDVPRLPVDEITGLGEFGTTLASFYRDMGVWAGGGGSFCGLRIDHVAQAVMGTPIANGLYSPSRTAATLQQPLLALCEVVYNDVLLPFLDTVVVLKAEWQYVDEKVYGIIAQVKTMAGYYNACKPHLSQILWCLAHIYEMMRQCQIEDQGFAFHLKHPQYVDSLRRTLRGELTVRMCEVQWQLSTALLDMQIDARLRQPVPIEAWQPPPTITMRRRQQQQRTVKESPTRSHRSPPSRKAATPAEERGLSSHETLLHGREPEPLLTRVLSHAHEPEPEDSTPATELDGTSFPPTPAPEPGIGWRDGRRQSAPLIRSWYAQTPTLSHAPFAATPRRPVSAPVVARKVQQAQSAWPGGDRNPGTPPAAPPSPMPFVRDQFPPSNEVYLLNLWEEMATAAAAQRATCKKPGIQPTRHVRAAALRTRTAASNPPSRDVRSLYALQQQYRNAPLLMGAALVSDGTCRSTPLLNRSHSLQARKDFETLLTSHRRSDRRMPRPQPLLLHPSRLQR